MHIYTYTNKYHCYYFLNIGITFSRPVEQNLAVGFASCSLSFSRLLPKAKYMKNPASTEPDMMKRPSGLSSCRAGRDGERRDC